MAGGAEELPLAAAPPGGVCAVAVLVAVLVMKISTVRKVAGTFRDNMPYSKPMG